MEDSNKKLTAKVVIPMALLILINLFAPILISRKWDWLEAWIFGFAGLGTFIISRIIAAKKNPDIIAERGNYLKHKDIKPWDKVLAPLIGIFTILTVIAAGLEAIWRQTPIFSLEMKISLLVCILAGYLIGSWALITNTFFSGVVRLQKDRGQYVITTGPYSFVRHPGYASSILSYLAIPFFLDSLWGVLPAVLACVILIIRTGLEDKTLQNELEGYKEYAKNVKYRLIPGIW